MSKMDASWLANRFRIARDKIPPRFAKATVAVLRVKDTHTVPQGTGTLLRIADRSFVVTAGHVVKNAYEWDWGLAVTGSDGRIVETPSSWLVSPQGHSQPDSGLGDIAVYPLTEQQVRELEGKEFVRLTDLGLNVDLSRGFFMLLGFPQMLCEPSSRESEKVLLGGFTFATTIYQGTAHLSDYNPEVHFLLDAADENLLNGDGMETRLRGRHRVSVKLSSGLEGISGCGVWRIGNPRTTVENWTPEDAKLVGLAVSTYRDTEAIKATRWRFVMKLIYEAFPDMRASLKLLTRNEY